VQEGADDIFIVSARLISTRGGLKTMPEAIDRETAIVAPEQVQMCDETIRQFLGEAFQLTSNQLPSLLAWFR
jgi:hypothetical protein